MSHVYSEHLDFHFHHLSRRRLPSVIDCDMSDLLSSPSRVTNPIFLMFCRSPANLAPGRRPCQHNPSIWLAHGTTSKNDTRWTGTPGETAGSGEDAIRSKTSSVMAKEAPISSGMGVSRWDQPTIITYVKTGIFSIALN